MERPSRRKMKPFGRLRPCRPILRNLMGVETVNFEPVIFGGHPSPCIAISIDRKNFLS